MTLTTPSTQTDSPYSNIFHHWTSIYTIIQPVAK